MKILLSAYACESNKGSEPGVGYSWAIEIANRGHKVTVLTRYNNKENLTSINNSNISLEYLDILSPKIKKIIGLQVYYFLWQIAAFFKVRELIKVEKFDLIHHITFVSFKKYSFLGFFKIPFVFGPAGGGEESTKALIDTLPIKNQIGEFLRLLLNRLVKFNPISHIVFHSAKILFVTSKNTKKQIPSRFLEKTHIALAIGHNFKFISNNSNIENANSQIKLLYVGRFLDWKGIHLIIEALNLIKHKNIHLTLVGSGDFKNHLLNLISNYNLKDNITFIDWISQTELKEVYLKNDIFCFPSFHDSGGMVVLEAMSNNLPVISLKIGGPSMILKNSPCLIDSNLNTNNIIKKIAANIIKLHEDKHFKQVVLDIQANNFKENTWNNTVNKVYNIIEQTI